MRDHRFPIGLSVRLKDRAHLSPDAAETYRITAKLPLRDNWPQYRIRNDELGQERVSREDNLDPIEWGMTPFTEEHRQSSASDKPQEGYKDEKQT